MKKLIALILLFVCGCSGGSGEASFSFAGIWKSDFTLQKNDCGLTDTEIGETTLTVNQDGDQVVVDTPTGTTFVGYAPDDNSFTAENSFHGDINCSFNVEGNVTYGLEFIRGDSEDQATALLSIKTRCDGSLITCNVNYVAKSRRIAK